MKLIRFFTSQKLSLKNQINKDIALQHITCTKQKTMIKSFRNISAQIEKWQNMYTTSNTSTKVPNQIITFTVKMPNTHTQKHKHKQTSIQTNKYKTEK